MGTGSSCCCFSCYNEISDKATYRGVCFGSQIEHSVGHCGQRGGGGVRLVSLNLLSGSRETNAITLRPPDSLFI